MAALVLVCAFFFQTDGDDVSEYNTNEGCSIGLCLLVGWYTGLVKVSGKKTLKDYTALRRERCVTAGTAVYFSTLRTTKGLSVILS